MKYKRMPRLVWQGPILLMDKKEIGSWRARRFEPSARGERLGLAVALAGKATVLEYVLGRAAEALTDAERRFARLYFATDGRKA